VFIKRTIKKLKGRTYSNYLLVESVATPKGPRHRVVCSLGALAPAPKKQWLALAHHLQQSLSGQQSLLPHGTREQELSAEVLAAPTSSRKPLTRLLEIDTDGIEVQEARAAGAVYVGHQIWERLGLEAILKEAGLSKKTRLLTELMTLNRLVTPTSELAMSDWVRRSGLADILRKDFKALNEDRFYRNMDRLYPKRAQIETALGRREKTLFSLNQNILFYDLTSTYFEGLCMANPKAKRGFSRDSRPDCKQVVIGLVLDGDGFPKAHEVFAGNRCDTTTVEEMLKVIEQRMGENVQATVVVDRGMSSTENLAAIRARGHHWLVAGAQSERAAYLEEFEDEEGWQEIVREASPRNPGQKKLRVLVKAAAGLQGAQTLALCWSEGRTLKDRAIREKQEARFLSDLEKLQRRVTSGRLRQEAKIHEAIGRLKERYPRVARYYQIDYAADGRLLSWSEERALKDKALTLDGSYLLKTSRSDMGVEEIWRTYILLTRVESAFRNMKSPLCERPIFHHLERRVETHIFLCVLAYHLLVCIERAFLDRGIHTSWATLREQLSTHQIVTVRLPASDGRVLMIRRDSRPEEVHEHIYRTLRIAERILPPIKQWLPADSH